MKEATLEDAVETAISFYIDNNYEVPKNVVQYIACFPKGLSRQMIQARYGIKTSEFVKLLNPTYQKPLEASERAIVECKRLNYKLITNPNTLKTNRCKVEAECLDCGYIHTTTITSLSGSSLGCPKCKSGNLPWAKRTEELDEILLENFKAIRISEVPCNEQGYVTVQHLMCGTEYTTQLLGIINPSSPNRGSCPNCRSSDRRVTFEGVTFGSNFELECYKIIRKFNPEAHVKYSDHFSTKRKWLCDFVIGDLWIEVSNFKADYKNYFQNIQEKELLVESNDRHFFFIRSLREMEEFASLM